MAKNSQLYVCDLPLTRDRTKVGFGIVRNPKKPGTATINIYPILLHVFDTVTGK